MHLLALVFFNRYTYFCVSYIIVISDRIGHIPFKMHILCLFLHIFFHIHVYILPLYISPVKGLKMDFYQHIKCLSLCFQFVHVTWYVNLSRDQICLNSNHNYPLNVIFCQIHLFIHFTISAIN